MKKALQFMGSLLRDVCLVSGLALIVYGIYCIFEPAAYIAAGVFLSIPAIPKQKRRSA